MRNRRVSRGLAPTSGQQSYPAPTTGTLSTCRRKCSVGFARVGGSRTPPVTSAVGYERWLSRPNGSLRLRSSGVLRASLVSSDRACATVSGSVFQQSYERSPHPCLGVPGSVRRPRAPERVETHRPDHRSGERDHRSGDPRGGLQSVGHPRHQGRRRVLRIQVATVSIASEQPPSASTCGRCETPTAAPAPPAPSCEWG